MAYKNQKAKKRASRAQASKKDSNSRDGGQSPMQNRPKSRDTSAQHPIDQQLRSEDRQHVGTRSSAERLSAESTALLNAARQNKGSRSPGRIHKNADDVLEILGNEMGLQKRLPNPPRTALKGSQPVNSDVADRSDLGHDLREDDGTVRKIHASLPSTDLFPPISPRKRKRNEIPNQEHHDNHGDSEKPAKKTRLQSTAEKTDSLALDAFANTHTPVPLEKGTSKGTKARQDWTRNGPRRSARLQEQQSAPVESNESPKPKSPKSGGHEQRRSSIAINKEQQQDRPTRGGGVQKGPSKEGEIGQSPATSKRRGRPPKNQSSRNSEITKAKETGPEDEPPNAELSNAKSKKKRVDSSAGIFMTPNESSLGGTEQNDDLGRGSPESEGSQEGSESQVADGQDPEKNRDEQTNTGGANESGISEEEDCNDLDQMIHDESLEAMDNSRLFGQVSHLKELLSGLGNIGVSKKGGDRHNRRPELNGLKKGQVKNLCVACEETVAFIQNPSLNQIHDQDEDGSGNTITRTTLLNRKLGDLAEVIDDFNITESNDDSGLEPEQVIQGTYRHIFPALIRVLTAASTAYDTHFGGLPELQRWKDANQCRLLQSLIAHLDLILNLYANLEAITLAHPDWKPSPGSSPPLLQPIKSICAALKPIHAAFVRAFDAQQHRHAQDAEHRARLAARAAETDGAAAIRARRERERQDEHLAEIWRVLRTVRALVEPSAARKPRFAVPAEEDEEEEEWDSDVNGGGGSADNNDDDGGGESEVDDEDDDDEENMYDGDDDDVVYGENEDAAVVYDEHGEQGERVSIFGAWLPPPPPSNGDAADADADADADSGVDVDADTGADASADVSASAAQRLRRRRQEARRQRMRRGRARERRRATGANWTQEEKWALQRALKAYTALPAGAPARRGVGKEVATWPFQYVFRQCCGYQKALREKDALEIVKVAGRFREFKLREAQRSGEEVEAWVKEIPMIKWRKGL